MVDMTTLANSSYLDWTSWRTTQPTTPEIAFGFTSTSAADAGHKITIAFVLERVEQPADLLALPWAERQAALASMDEATLWATYGADSATYTTVRDSLRDDYGATLLGHDDNYVSSAESRTVWAELDATNFAALFGTPLMVGELPDGGGEMFYWENNLSVPTDWNISGLWFDEVHDIYPNTAVENMADDATETLPPNTVLGTGNSSFIVTHLNPAEIAALYNFPELGDGAIYGITALAEPQVGITYDNSSTINVTEFEHRLNDYLTGQGLSGTAKVYHVGTNQTYSSSSGGERSLDVGIVAAVNPGSEIGIYAGSGSSSNFVANQQAIWVEKSGGGAPTVLSSSFRDDAYSAPGSPFLNAYSELFVDAALKRITVFTSAGDLGSGHETANGLTNVNNIKMSPYVLVVGGTSASTLSSAQMDATLVNAQGIYTKAMAGDLDTLKMLVAGGLKTLPAALASSSLLVETVWNSYTTSADGEPVGFTGNNAGSGGVDTSQPTPSYQSAFGLTPTALGPSGGLGRGLPDVALDAGGNLHYTVPGDDMRGTSSSWGTSAAAPMWTALTARLGAIFTDQGLPALGYMNDLLYIVAAIAPGAFNDVQVGDNTSSYRQDSAGNIIPTGFGYSAEEGYDLATGLGSPNGLLLARALTQLAHSQIYYADIPELLTAQGDGSWTSSIDQTLLVQPTLPSGAGFTFDGNAGSAGGVAASNYGWSSQFAQQALQQDFAPDLVTLFDGKSLGLASDAHVAAGEAVSITIGGAAVAAPQGTLTSAFGFVEFSNDSGAVDVARAVAVAELAGDVTQEVAVRMRQNGADTLSIMFYQADDYAGTVDGVRPGDAGYGEQAAAHAIATSGGATQIESPGYGQYGSATLVGIDPGDLIAMRLTDLTTGETYYGFSAANADGAGHLWSFGLNTWGWEDTYGGGDTDYNDLVVQLDFTSYAGSGWLV